MPSLSCCACRPLPADCRRHQCRQARVHRVAAGQDARRGARHGRAGTAPQGAAWSDYRRGESRHYVYEGTVDTGYVGEVMSCHVSVIRRRRRHDPAPGSDDSLGATTLTIPFGHTVDAFWLAGELRPRWSSDQAMAGNRYAATAGRDSARQRPGERALGQRWGGVPTSRPIPGLAAAIVEVYGREGTLVASGPNSPQLVDIQLQGAKAGENGCDLAIPAQYTYVPAGMPRKRTTWARCMPCSVRLFVLGSLSAKFRYCVAAPPHRHRAGRRTRGGAGRTQGIGGRTCTLFTAQPPMSPQAAREVRRNTLRRQGRTCYDHLAGVVGVQLLEALLQRGWLEESAGPRPRYRLTPSGRQALQGRGVALPDARSAAAVCLWLS